MQEEKRSKARSIVIGVLLVIAFILLIIAIVLFIYVKKYPDATIFNKSDNIALSLDVSQGDYIKPEEELTSYQKGITLPGWSEFTLVANKSDNQTGIDFFNPVDNLWYTCPKCGRELHDFKCDECQKTYSNDEAIKNFYYLTFNLILDDTGESLYESGLVLPDKHIQSINLNRSLDVGEYEASVFIQPYLMDGTTKCNNGSIKVHLNVVDI